MENEVEGAYAVGRGGDSPWNSREPQACASLGGPKSAAAHTRVTLDLGPGQAFSP